MSSAILAVRAEWTKLRTVPGPGWLLLAAVALSIGLSAAAAAAQACRTDGCGTDPVKIGLTGVQLGQIVVAILAVMSIGDEYRNDLIRTTLAATPRRALVLAAKAVTVAAPVVVSAAIAVAGCLLVSRAWLTSISPTAGPTLRACIGSVLYLALIALLSLGIAAVVRDPGAAIGTVLGLLYLFPLLAHIVTDVHWQRRLEQIAPGNAGLAIQTTVGLDRLPIGPWSGLGVLSAWAAGAVLAGFLALRLRDA
jgi:ABC-2 type transport system permease protein